MNITCNCTKNEAHPALTEGCCCRLFHGPGTNTARNGGYQANATHNEPSETHCEYIIHIKEKAKWKIKLL